jgi:hypothetical protein
MKPLKYFLLAVCVPALVAVYSGRGEPQYIFSNLVFYGAPQVLWWLFCIIWWSCWRPRRNRGLFFGGIGAAGVLLLRTAWYCFRSDNSDGWWFYIDYSPASLVLGGLAGGIAGTIARRLSKKAQLGTPPKGGPALRFRNSGVSEGPPSVN